MVVRPKGNDRQHTELGQGRAKYSYSYHSREQIYAENLVSVMTILSSAHLALILSTTVKT